MILHEIPSILSLRLLLGFNTKIVVSLSHMLRAPLLDSHVRIVMRSFFGLHNQPMQLTIQAGRMSIQSNALTSTPSREQSHDASNNRYTPNTDRHHPQPRKAFPNSPNIYGAGFHRRELRYASLDAIHAHYLNTQPSRLRESNVDVLENNINDIEHDERRTQKASEEFTATEASISKLREEMRGVHDAVRLSTMLKEHWKGETRRVEDTVL